MEYDFKIIYRAGVNLQTADALSWLNTDGTDDSEIEYVITVMSVTPRARSQKYKSFDTTLKKL